MYSSSFSSSLPIFVVLLLSSLYIVVDALKFSDPHPGYKNIHSMVYKVEPPEKLFMCEQTMGDIDGPVVSITESYWNEIAAQVPIGINPVCGTPVQIETPLGIQIALVATAFRCNNCAGDELQVIYPEGKEETAHTIFGNLRRVWNVRWIFMGNRNETTTSPSATTSATDSATTSATDSATTSVAETGQKTLVFTTDGNEPTGNTRRSRKSGGKWFGV